MHQRIRNVLNVVFLLLCVLGVSVVKLSAQQKTTYDQPLLPLLKDKCVSCHGPDKSRGGLDVSTYGKLMEGGSSGPVVKPGAAEASRLFLLVAHKEEPAMPPKSEPIPAA